MKKQQELNKGSELCLSLQERTLYNSTPERTIWRKYLEDCSLYIEIDTVYGSN